MRLKEYDERAEVAKLLGRLLRLSAVKAKSLGCFELARRLVESGFAAEGIAYYCTGGASEAVELMFRALGEDLYELSMVMAVDDLPTWEEVKDNG